MPVIDQVKRAINQTETNRQKLWLAAIKPPMYTVAVIPITFGTALAYQAERLFNLNIFLTFLGSAILIIAWLNLSNDVFDSDTGIDLNKPHSVVNLTGNRNLVFWLSNFCLFVGLTGIFLINYWLKDWTIFYLILGCCALGYSYQGPPFRFGYLGLGEIICFITFGPMAIASAYYSQTQSVSVNALISSSIIGISTSIILLCSHFHQVEDDLAAGKKSPVARLGTQTSSEVLNLSVISIYGLTGALIIGQILPLSTLIVGLSIPFAYQLITHVNQYHAQPEKVKNCKFIAVNLHFVSGLLLCLGLVL
jgi:1,4-dihydroxy-2-naphthoate octaprenyltransferase